MPSMTRIKFLCAKTFPPSIIDTQKESSYSALISYKGTRHKILSMISTRFYKDRRRLHEISAYIVVFFQLTLEPIELFITLKYIDNKL